MYLLVVVVVVRTDLQTGWLVKKELSTLLFETAECSPSLLSLSLSFPLAAEAVATTGSNGQSLSDTQQRNSSPFLSNSEF